MPRFNANGMQTVFQADGSPVSLNPVDARERINAGLAFEQPPVVTAGASADVNPASNTAWRLITSLARAPGYRWALYQFLQVAHVAGKTLPKARDFLEWLKSNPDPELQVMPDGLKYNDGAGNPKEANLKAIQQAIKGLLQK
jgi:hypothetical protein